MPTMYEIYEKFSDQYDELIKYEDHNGNLPKLLSEYFKENQTVLELGCGTGRVTSMYIDTVKKAICCDKHQHMIDKAKKNLKSFEDKIEYKCIDTRDIGKLDIRCDIVIEAWAVGHTLIDEFSAPDKFLKSLFENIYDKLNENAKIIFIETMGSNVSEPTIPLKELDYFYDKLENVYGMERTIIETDYKFPTIQDARNIMTFFFGEQITEDINSNIVKEFTGIWTASN